MTTTTRKAGRARPGRPVRRPRQAPAAARRSRAVLVGASAAAALACVLAFGLGSWVNRSDPAEARIAELQQAEAARDVEQLEQLTELAFGSQERLGPVLIAMAAAVPLDPEAPQAAPTSTDVGAWRDTVESELERYTESPSAGNGVNIARSGMHTAVRQLAAAVDAFEAATAAEAPLKPELLTLAGELRTLALHSWSLGALQLDISNIEAGNGHVHVQLHSGGSGGHGGGLGDALDH